jgi:hypothetical protein
MIINTTNDMRQHAPKSPRFFFPVFVCILGAGGGGPKAKLQFVYLKSIRSLIGCICEPIKEAQYLLYNPHPPNSPPKKTFEVGRWGVGGTQPFSSHQ